MTVSEKPLGVDADANSIPGAITLTGLLQFNASKCGVRYCELHVAEPYHHSLHVAIYGGAGRSADDDLNDDLFDKLDTVCTVTFWVDELGDNNTMPSYITAQAATPMDELQTLGQQYDQPTTFSRFTHEEEINDWLNTETIIASCEGSA